MNRQNRRRPFDPTLYLVVGSADTRGRPVEDVVRAAVAGGVTMVQLREKALPDAPMIDLARRLIPIVRSHAVAFIINDRIEVALAVDADGVHLGQDDRDPVAARAALGPDRIIGVSAGTPEEAARVDPAVADYAGVGSVFPTATKPDAGPAIGLDGLRALSRMIPLPVVAIGGINRTNAAHAIVNGADGVAVVSAICAAPDPCRAARALRAEITAVKGRQVD
ncbi:MAG: thiamine phosphate synthase [Alphaproteobacteria bacterium]|nr:MAG: thiamine phosphate synthase [Alphaproteobacteria bacterium]